jgi:hypothetical protein
MFSRGRGSVYIHLHKTSVDTDKAEDNDNNGKNDEFLDGSNSVLSKKFKQTVHIISLRYRTSRFRPGARSLVFDPRETPGRAFSPLSTSTVMDTVECDVFTICNLHDHGRNNREERGVGSDSD